MSVSESNAFCCLLREVSSADPTPARAGGAKEK